MRSLIAMARATNDLDKTLMAIIDSLQVETIGRETVLTSRPVSALRLAQDSLFAETVKDWTAVLSTIVTPKSESRWLDGKLVTNQGTDKGIAKLNCGNPRFGTACFMSQSLKAPNYQGKRVRLIAELGCEELMHHHSGVILWAADAQDNTVSNATSGNSMTLIEEKNLAMDKLFLIRDVPPPVVWREHSVEMDVSDKATVLSLGIYTSIADVLLRNVRYEVVGEATGEQPKHSLVNAPRNLLHLPGGVLLDQPTNLDFSKLPEDAPKPTSGSDQPARTAARPASGNTTR